jgi:hypothetical protein
VAGFLDQRSQRPGVSQEIVHPLPQPLAILIVIHGPSTQPLVTFRSSIS